MTVVASMEQSACTETLRWGLESLTEIQRILEEVLRKCSLVYNDVPGEGPLSRAHTSSARQQTSQNTRTEGSEWLARRPAGRDTQRGPQN